MKYELIDEKPISYLRLKYEWDKNFHDVWYLSADGKPVRAHVKRYGNRSTIFDVSSNPSQTFALRYRRSSDPDSL